MTRRHVYTTRKGDRESVYDVHRLWKLTADFPVEEVPVESLDIDKAVWFHSRCPPLTEVLRHFEKVLAADLDYPVILNSAGKIMDGFHRVMKARLQGQRTVSIVRFEVDPEPDEVRTIDAREHRSSRKKTRAEASDAPADGYVRQLLRRLNEEVAAETERLRTVVAKLVDAETAATLAAGIDDACAALLAKLQYLPDLADAEPTGDEDPLAAALEIIAAVHADLVADERFAVLERASTELQVDPQHRPLLVAALGEMQATLETLALCRPSPNVEPPSVESRPLQAVDELRGVNS